MTTSSTPSPDRSALAGIDWDAPTPGGPDLGDLADLATYDAECPLPGGLCDPDVDHDHDPLSPEMAAAIGGDDEIHSLSRLVLTDAGKAKLTEYLAQRSGR